MGSSSSSGIGLCLCLFLGLDLNLTLLSFLCIFPAPFGWGSFCSNSPSTLGLYWGGAVFQVDLSHQILSCCPVETYPFFSLNLFKTPDLLLSNLVGGVSLAPILSSNWMSSQGSINIPKCPLVIFTNNSASMISQRDLEGY